MWPVHIIKIIFEVISEYQGLTKAVQRAKLALLIQTKGSKDDLSRMQTATVNSTRG